MAALPVVDDDGLVKLGRLLQVEVARRDLQRRKADVHSRMQRLDAAGDAVGYRAALVEGVVVEERLRALTVELD